jgi:hypothetical protein
MTYGGINSDVYPVAIGGFCQQSRAHTQLRDIHATLEMVAIRYGPSREEVKGPTGTEV